MKLKTEGATFAHTPKTLTSVFYFLFQQEQAHPILQLTTKPKSIGEGYEENKTQRGSSRLLQAEKWWSLARLWGWDFSEQLRIIKHPAPSKIQRQLVCLPPSSQAWALIQKCPFLFRTAFSCGLHSSQESPGIQPWISPTARFGEKAHKKANTGDSLNSRVQSDSV